MHLTLIPKLRLGNGIFATLCTNLVPKLLLGTNTFARLCLVRGGRCASRSSWKGVPKLELGSESEKQGF